MKIRDDRLAMSKDEKPFDRLVCQIMQSNGCDYWKVRDMAYNRVLANPAILKEFGSGPC